MNKINQLPILVTGGCGMVGSHIVDFYYEKGEKIHATYYTQPTINLDEVLHKANYFPLDVRQKDKVFEAINNIKPSVIYHLAAQSYPTVSWEKPDETIDININGTVNVFEAIKAVKKSNPSYDPMVVIACSSAEYGASLLTIDGPVLEDIPLLPLHPYGVSKVGQDLLGFQYFQNDGIRNIRARIFNTTGPRKVNDVVSDFTKRTVLWEQGKIDSIAIGNIETKRAITDVRDLIQALMLLAEKGNPGDVYNISGEHVYQIKEIIEIIETKIDKQLPTQLDQKLIRPTDEPIIYGNSDKLKAATGWAQSYHLKTTIDDMIEYWRGVL